MTLFRAFVRRFLAAYLWWFDQSLGGRVLGVGMRYQSGVLVDCTVKPVYVSIWRVSGLVWSDWGRGLPTGNGGLILCDM